MAFSDHLKQVISSVDGAIACSVMGFDGISVETVYSKAGEEESAALDLSAAWVEYANVLSQARVAAETLKTGKIAELSVNSEKIITLMRMVTPDYFLVVGLQPQGNYGKARYILRVVAPKVAQEL